MRSDRVPEPDPRESMATMNGMPIEGDRERRRVLLVVRGDRDRELLSSWLSAEFEVTTAGPEDDWGPFDVCIVDAASFDAARPSLVAHREDASPMFLPVLLLVPEDQHGAEWIGREVGDTVDQVLTVPTRKRFLRSHLESLLRTRRLSQELAEQHERSEVYRRAMEEAAVGIIITDPTRADNPITYVNDRFEEITGYEASEILGRNCRFLQGPDTDEEPVRRMREAIDAGEPVTVELLNYRKDGTPFWNRVTITPVYGKDDGRGEVTCFLGFQEDVTESRERQREVREMATSFRELYATASDRELSFEEKLQEILDLGANRLGVGVGFFTRIEDETQTIVAARGDHELLQPGEVVPLDRSYCRRTIDHDGALAVEDAVGSDTWDGPAYETFGLGCYVGSTVQAGGEVYGTLCFADDDPREEPFTDWETTLVGLMAQWVGYELERQAREEELREQKERFHRLVAQVEEYAIFMLDPDGHVVSWNDGAERIKGYTASEILGEHFSVFYPEEDVEDGVPDRVLDRAAADGQFESEGWRVRKDGSRFWAVATLTAIRDEDGALEGFAKVTRDMTDRRERERELEQYETIVEAAGDPIYAVDSNGRFTLANEACLQVFDTSREELYGSDATAVLDPETYGAFDELVADLLNGEERQRTIEIPVSFDGERRLFEVSVALVSQDGDYQGSVGVARDVTELRQRERRLTVLDRVLRHNLRNKMNIVLARAEAIAEETDDPELGAYARAIERASSQLLDLSEEARRFEETIHPDRRETETWDIAALVEKVIDAARTDHPEADIAADLPGEAWVRGPGTLELALAELVENAVEHSDRDRPAVRVSVTTEGDEVAIGIADDGPGFGEMERRALLRGSEHPLEHLEGIGLWLVRWTITGAGGDLDIQENDPRGSVVTVRLPRVIPEPGDGGG